MGSFANALFLGLLGWTRTVVFAVWSVFSGNPGTSLLSWIGENWIFLVAVLCIAGWLSDLTIYLIRWRPYRVWASFFRRLRRGSGNGADEAGNLPPEAPSSGEEADETAFEAPAASGYSQADEPEAGTEAERAPWGWEREASESIREPQYVPDDRGYRGYRSDGSREVPGVSDMTSRFEQAIRPRRRRSTVKRLFRDDEQETEYTAPQELIDHREAYRRPVYPRNWKGYTEQNNRDQESS